MSQVRNILYSKKYNTIVRFFSVIAFLIILAVDIMYFIEVKQPSVNPATLNRQFFTIITDIFYQLMAIFLFIFPAKLELLASGAFYCFFNLTFDPGNSMCLPMFILGVTILNIRGYYDKNRNKKIKITLSILVLTILTNIRFGWTVFFNSLINYIGYSFVTLLTLFFANQYYVDNKEIPVKKNILNLADFPTLNTRDKEFLTLLQQNKLYKEIALINNINEGTVRNRMSYIFTVLQTGDKIGFLTKYKDYDIIFNLKLVNVK